MKLLERRRKQSDLSAVDRIVTSALGQLGLADDAQRDQDGDVVRWQLSWGPAEATLLLVPPEEGFEGGLRIRVQLMSLPEGTALPLYRRLLDLNASELVESAFGLDRELVVLTSECSWPEITQARAERLIAGVCHAIERHAESLASEFGCIRACEFSP